MSSHVHGVKVAGHGDGKAYIYVDDAEGLVSLIQMGRLSFMPGARPCARPLNKLDRAVRKNPDLRSRARQLELFCR